MKNILKQVNDVYNEKNPSTYFRDEKKITEFIENRKEFLLKLKLPPKIFKNSKLIDFGCGTGQNSLVYDYLGARCTLLEYDKFSYDSCNALFKKFSKNKYEIFNDDIFKFKLPKETYDFVVSNGVAHHTKEPIKNVQICCNVLKPGGFFIFGIGNKAGFFQRNLQRFILYSISNNKDEIIKYSKILFKNHLNRSVKYSGRMLDEVVYDTYLNPKIYNFGTRQIIDLFKKNNLSLYSSFQDLKFVNQFLETNTNQFKIRLNKDVNFKDVNQFNDIILSDFEDFSLSNNELNNSKIYKQLKSLTSVFDEVSDKINDINFMNFENLHSFDLIKNIELYKNKILQLNKIDILNKSHNKIFLDEVLYILNILNNKKSKLEKFNELNIFIKKSKKIFKLVNGVGLNYYVGYKKEK